MQVRLRESTPHEKFLTRCDLQWQPEARKDKWYPLKWQNISHEDRLYRCNVVNMVYKHRLPVICRASYNRTRHVLTILKPTNKHAINGVILALRTT